VEWFKVQALSLNLSTTKRKKKNKWNIYCTHQMWVSLFLVEDATGSCEALGKVALGYWVCDVVTKRNLRTHHKVETKKVYQQRKDSAQPNTGSGTSYNRCSEWEC
jgi:hypothetical protein